MSSLVARCLILILSLSLHGSGLGQVLEDASPLDSANPNLRVHVLLYDYASVPEEMLTRAEELANFIFSQTGVEVEWVEKTALNKGPGAPTLEDMDLILRILPWPRATLARRSAMGEALSCGLAREGCIASVFFNRVKRLAYETRISLHQVLGHAIANELGHLLLGPNSHSGRGLMRAGWGSRGPATRCQGRSALYF